MARRENLLLDNREMFDVVNISFVSGQNIADTVRIWTERFPNRQAITRYTVRSIVSSLYEWGTFETLRHAQGRGHSGLAVDVKQAILEAPRLLLYKRDPSPPSNAVRVVGAVLGLRFDFLEPNLLGMEHRTPEFRKINPMATIPVLQDGDFILAESHAINLYLLNKYGSVEHKEALYPAELRTRALVDQCLYFDAGVLFKRLLEVSQPAFIGKTDSASNTQIRNIEEGYSTLEAYLQARPFVACDRFTLADASLGSTVAALQEIQPVDAGKFPKCKDWLERLHAEPNFKELSGTGGILFGKLLRSLWKKNKKE